MIRVAVIDLGTGNLRSVAKAAEHVADKSCDVQITRNLDKINQADRIILPGQGAIGSWLSALSDPKLKSILHNALNNKPVLGICVGMQALFEHNEEDGGHECLGVFKGNVIRFEDGLIDKTGLTMKVPQMGWNQVNITQDHPLWTGIENNSWFYFLHSYYAPKSNADQVFAVTEYGVPYASAVAKDNIFAIQCHPEKSHRVGLKLFENFINWRI